MSTFVKLPIEVINEDQAELIKQALHMQENGMTHRCPTCHRRTVADRRRLDKGKLLPLIHWYQTIGVKVSRPNSIFPLKRDLQFTQSKHWSLIEKIGAEEIAEWSEASPRPNKGWRITEDFGEPFLLGQIKIRPVAIVFNDMPVAHEGRPKFISEILRGF